MLMTLRSWVNGFRSGSLRTGLLWATVGGAVYLACQYGMLVAIARIGTRADVGEFALAQAIAAPFIIVSQMQLRQLQITDVRGMAALGDYLVARGMATGLALLGIGIVVLLLRTTGQMAAILVVVALAKAFESISDIAHGQMQRKERLDLVAVSLVLKGVLSLAGLTAALVLTRSLVTGVLVMAAVWAAVLCLYDLPGASRLRGPGESLLAWHPRLLRSLAWTSFPLTVASGLVSLSGNLPRYFLDAFSGKEAVGLFTVGAIPLVLVGVVNNAVSLSTLPRAATYFQGGELNPFMRLARRIVALQVLTGLALAVMFWVFGRGIMRALFAPEYESAASVAVLLALGVSVNGLAGYGSTVIAAARRFWIQLGNIIVAILIQLGLCIMLIPWHGVTGAGVAEVAKYAVATIYLSAAGFMVHRRQCNSLATGMTSRPL